MAVLKREAEVITNLERQPLWFKVFKLTLMVVTFLFFTVFFHILAALLWFACLFLCGTTVHFVYRWKTEGWTRSWGKWIHDSESIRSPERLFYAYFLVSWALTGLSCFLIFSMLRLMGF